MNRCLFMNLGSTLDSRTGFESRSGGRCDSGHVTSAASPLDGAPGRASRGSRGDGGRVSAGVRLVVEGGQKSRFRHPSCRGLSPGAKARSGCLHEAPASGTLRHPEHSGIRHPASGNASTPRDRGAFAGKRPARHTPCGGRVRRAGAPWSPARGRCGGRRSGRSRAESGSAGGGWPPYRSRLARRPGPPAGRSLRAVPSPARPAAG